MKNDRLIELAIEGLQEAKKRIDSELTLGIGWSQGKYTGCRYQKPNSDLSTIMPPVQNHYGDYIDPQSYPTMVQLTYSA